LDIGFKEGTNMKNLVLKITFLSLVLVSCKDQVSDNAASVVTDTRPATECIDTDTVAPTLDPALQVSANGSKLVAPTLAWTKATEACEFSHYELAIGTSPGSSDVMVFTNIGTVVSYQQNGMSLDYAKDYFYSLVAVDRAGNKSTPVNSSAWNIFTPNTLTNLVLWLDAADTTTIEDNEGDSPGDTDFSSEIKTWKDISGSSAIHNFTASGLTRPNWDVTENAVRFNGSNHFMATADHPDINTSVVAQRSLTVAVKTDSDISSRQVIFEEGGTVRGLNIYIEQDKLHCGFWNNTNDGDGVQPFVAISDTIATNEEYVVSFLFDYSHFSGASGADGTLECFVNGKSIGQASTTSRLHAHGGDIGLGAMNDGSYFSGGSDSGDDHFLLKS